MNELARFKREMAGLKREFAKFRRQFRKLDAEFKEHAEAVHANWEKTDRLMVVHTRDMEVFRDSQERRCARQREVPSKALEILNAEKVMSSGPKSAFEGRVW
jgi:hypothetical protein